MIKQENKLIAEFMKATYDNCKVNFGYSHNSVDNLIKRVEDKLTGCYCDEDQGDGYSYEQENGDCDICIEYYQKLFLDGGLKHSHTYTHYHESYDWLMPVVEKIEGLGIKVTIINNSCKINTFTSEYNSTAISDTKINAIYTAIIEFIKWYNKQK